MIKLGIGTQKWVMGLSLYFIGLMIIITLFSIAGHTENIVVDNNFKNKQYYNSSINAPSETISVGLTGVSYSWTTWFKDVFSFFVWDLNVYNTGNETDLFQYFWIFRILVVYIPLLALILSIWYSVPTVSG